MRSDRTVLVHLPRLLATSLCAVLVVAATAVAYQPVLGLPKTARLCKLTTPESGLPGGGYLLTIDQAAAKLGRGPSSIGVSGVTCAAGKRLVKAYYLCRQAHGGRAGHCAGVLGYACAERRSGTSFQILGAVACRSGKSRLVTHVYEESLR